MLKVKFIVACLLALGLSGVAWSALAPYQIDASAANSVRDPEIRIDYGSFQWVWLEANDAATARGNGVRLVAMRGNTVRIGDVELDPVLSSSAPTTDDAGRYLQIVQFFGPAKREWIAEIEAQGVRVLQYLPDNAVLAFGPPRNANTLEAAPVRARASFDATFRRDRSLAQSPPGRSNGIVVMYASVDTNDLTEALIVKAGASIVESRKAQPDGLLRYARVIADAATRDRLLAIPTVINVSYEREMQLDDEAANLITAFPYTTPAALVPGYSPFLLNTLNGLDGAGVIWAVVDTGVDRDHPDLAPGFVGGITQGCTVGPGGQGDDDAGGGHGTHVAGAIAGRGVGDGSGLAAERDANGFLYGQGVAPATQLYGARVVCAGNTLSNAEGTRLSLAAGASGSNNSWNNGAALSGYTASAREYDVLVRDADFTTSALTEAFTVMFSAGNQGSAGMTAPHEAKNIISVANSGSSRSASTGPNVVSSSSSRGPAVDGRILPILTAVGTNTAATRNALGGSCATAIAGTEGLYALCSGTSMSTPRASGAAALVVQWWRRNNLNASPSPAMVKAVLVNGARDIPGSNPGDLNNIDGSRPIPNNDEGWGIINLQDTLAPTVRGVYLDQQQTLTTVGDQRPTRVVAVDANKPLKITLAWTDAPGAVSANPSLVNNLDLAVQSASASYLGNVFTGGSSSTGGTPDTRSNLENVYVINPGGLVHTITVTAAALGGDALSGNGTPGTPRQDYALVCTNCRLAPPLALTNFGPSNISACVGSNQVGPVALRLSGVLDPSQTANLSLVSPPASVTASSFIPNNLVPTEAGNNVAFSLNLAAATPVGTLPLTLRASAASSSNSDLNFSVQIVNLPVPGSVALTQPAANAIGVARNTAFTWTSVPGASSYRLEYARDASFTGIIRSVEVSTNSFTPSALLRANATYFWRVSSGNVCGASAFASGSFSTVVADTYFSDGFGE